MHGGSLEDATLQKKLRDSGESTALPRPLSAPRMPNLVLIPLHISHRAIGYRAIGYRLSVETRGHNNPKSEAVAVVVRVVPVPRPAENICAILVV